MVNDLDREPADNTVEKIKNSGGEALSLYGNVTDDSFGQIAVLISYKNKMILVRVRKF